MRGRTVYVGSTQVKFPFSFSVFMRFVNKYVTILQNVKEAVGVNIMEGLQGIDVSQCKWQRR